MAAVTPLDALAPEWPALSALLDEALSLPLEERLSWLDALPNASSALKSTLRRLLEVQAGVETGDYLDQLPAMPLPGSALPPGSEPAAGAVVGPYRLLAELGRGGMGTVWRAERADGQLRRQVALKLPRLAWGGGLAERLARERDILATLEHVHIARLYDAGVDGLGRPYLAMEYVEGEPIDAWCRERGMSLRARLALLLQVCLAVAHAHARLIVHRDLKPSNILVTGDGQVRLLDFGIAKLMEGDRTEETALTQVSGRALTLDYASPEQIRGEPLGTASDVYSLAVVAYELLAGARPYRLRRGSAAELEEAIADAVPARASDAALAPEVKRALRGDLDAILAKALKKAPAERYPTIAAFADDIERHLRGHAVAARPDSRWYLARKFVLRNRVPVAALALVLAALSGGLGTALWQAHAARKSEQAAEAAGGREAVVKMMMMDTLMSVASLDADEFRKPGAVARMLKDKLAEFEKRYQDSPGQRLGMLEAVAVQLPFLGDFAGSLEVGERYLALLRRTGAEPRRVIRAHLGNARALWSLERLPEAEATLREALALPADDLYAARERVAVLSQLAKTLMRFDRREEAGQALAEAELVLRRFHDGSVQWDLRMARARLDIGYDDPAVLRAMEQAHAEYLRDPEARSAEVGTSYLYVGSALRSVGRSAEAEAALAEADRRFEAIYGKVDRDTVLAFARHAASLADQGRYDEARRLLERRRGEVEANPGADTTGALATLTGRQLEAELTSGDLEAAARYVTIGDDATLSLPSARDRSVYLVGEGRLLALTGRADEAARRLERWLAARPEAERRVPESFRIRLVLAETRLAQGRTDLAAPELSALIATLQGQKATRTALYREAVELSALVGARQGAAVAAAALLDDYDRSAERTGIEPPSRVGRADSSLRRAEVLVLAGRTDEARRLVSGLSEDLRDQHPASPRLTAARELRERLAIWPR